MEVYEAFAHDAPVRLYLGLAVSVAAVVAAGLAVEWFPASAMMQAKFGIPCVRMSDVGAMRVESGRPQVCRF